MFKEMLLAGMLSTGIGAMSRPVNPYTKNVVYNDAEETIFFNLEESTYTYENLYNCIYYVYNDMEELDSNYEIDIYSGDTLVYNLVYSNYDDGSFTFASTESGVTLYVELNNNDYKFYIDDDSLYDYLEGNYDKWSFVVGGYYSDFKNAVALDIQANRHAPLLPVLSDIVSLLVGGITALGAGIGAGVSDLVSDIFISNGALSVFGALIAIFGGIALAIGLSRWVMRFLTTLGNKK